MRNILLGVSGGIAAYKVGGIITGLRKAGHEVHVVMTGAATRFITPFTLESLSATPVLTDMFEPPRQHAVEHIQTARRADLFLIAPCTANVIGKLAHGIADDYLTTVALAVTCPVVICPAMDHNMYYHPVVQTNVDLLSDRGYYIIEPEEGRLASGAMGTGRLPEPETILEKVGKIVPGWERYLSEQTDAEQPALSSTTTFVAAQVLSGRRVLVTAGPTREFIDPVRYLSNPSSGKMGYELARAAREAGAEVVLVSGPTRLEVPEGVELVTVTSAEEMADEVLKRFADTDVVIKAAAVSDYTPVTRSEHKLKKQEHGEGLVLELRRTRDILAELGKRKKDQFLVGFAAESQDLVENARNKLHAKNLDMVIANDVTAQGAGFAHDTNRVVIIGPGDALQQLELRPKRELADFIVGRIGEHI